MQKTYMPKPTDIERKWYVVDASGQTLGRLATRIAEILRGKHKPVFSPHVDGGDFVVIVNAADVALTGRKRENKVYYWHTGYPGGLRSKTAGELLDTNPERVIKLAVKGMLPNNKLGRRMLRRLKVYAGPEHPHQAQQPEELAV